jgi:hypothetical protein
VRERMGMYKYCAEKDHKQLADELTSELAAGIRKLTEKGQENA